MVKEIDLDNVRPTHLPVRTFAHPFDFKLDHESLTHEVGQNRASVDELPAIGWYEKFCDHETAEVFLVLRVDSEDNSKLAHCDGHHEWIIQQQGVIMERTLTEATHQRRIGHIITISTQEWAIVRLRKLTGWLDGMAPEVEKASRAKRDGCIGKILGIEVHVDPLAQNPLGEPVDLSLVTDESGADYDDDGEWDDTDRFVALAAAHGHKDY